MDIFRFVVLFFSCSFSFLIFSQKTDFNHYTTLRSEGEIPKDFNTTTFQKIQQDIAIERTTLSVDEHKDFAEKIHQSIDNLLQSGTIIYGDKISKYTSDIAKILLKDDAATFNKLRFYTIKSNIANAFSTDQGIIFVTTGLISQLTTEAELAYVLSHEIIHYTESHSVEWWSEYSSSVDLRWDFKKMSTYSQEREFEADAKGIELYLNAGYAKEQMITLFDVLAYSYLPIDEVPFPENYFNTSLCEIPQKKFTSKIFEIKMDEDYDDRRSSHPNIKRRKNKALEKADSLLGWQKNTFLLQEDRFHEIRDIARFDRLHADLIDETYTEAIYTLLILEKRYPESIYLNRIKAQAWLGLANTRYNQNEDAYDYDFNEDYGDFEREGQIAKLEDFIDKLKGIEIVTLAARIVQDIKVQFPDDKEINSIWKKTMRQLVIHSDFEIDDYSNLTYSDYLMESKKRDSSTTIDSILYTNDDLTKYEKIKYQRKKADEIAVLDSSNYFYYNISDLINMSEFKEIIKEFEDYEPEDEYDEFDDFYDDYGLSKKEKRKVAKELKRSKKNGDEAGEPILFSDIILVDPYAAQYNEEIVDLENSEKLLATVTSAFEKICIQNKYNLEILGSSRFDELNSEKFNQKSIYITLLNQLNAYIYDSKFPVDYTELAEMEAPFQNRKIVFLSYLNNLSGEEEYYYDERRGILERISNLFKSKRQSSFYMVVIDPKKQSLLLKKTISVKKSTSESEIMEHIKTLLESPVTQNKG